MNGKLIELRVSELLEKFGAGNHKPGSGSAAAFQGILSAQLLLTVIELTKNSKQPTHYAQMLPELLQIEANLKTQLLPELYELFQLDSDLFDRAIQLRRERDKQEEPLAKRKLDEEAVAALRPATEIPIRIAKNCLEIAKFSLEVFDHGFRSARGDSGVAMNAALSSLAGCLSIVELNCLSFEADEWTANIQASCNSLRAELDALTEQVRNRLSEQFALSTRRDLLSKEIQSIVLEAKGKHSISETDIERTATRLQRTIWIYRDVIWKTNIPESPFKILKPDMALKRLGFYVDHPKTLGQEVAGEINQQEKLVLISAQFPMEVQNFTAAHELGHSLLHTQNVLHRDRPLDGVNFYGRRSGDEWQADKFATYFLMPKKLVERTFLDIFLTNKFGITEETAFAINGGTPQMLRDECKNLRGLTRLLADTISYNAVNFQSLSERFKVSIEAMAIRLEELELVEF